LADYSEPYLTLKLNSLNFDTPAYDLPLDVWSAGQNIRFNDGATEKFSGESPVFGTPLFDPNWFIPVGYGANYYWLYADTTGVAVTDMSAHNDITPAAGVTGNINTNWNGGLINNYAVLNNGVDAPIWWDGAPSNIMTALPAWPANQTAEVIRPYKNYLIAMNISDASGDFPDMVHWSDAAPTGSVPASWDETDPTKDAGKYEISDTQGEIVDGAALGDLFVVYKRQSCHTIQFIGGQFIFKFRQLYGDMGILATNCVAEVNGRHLVLTTDDLVVHDGTSARPISILDNKARSWLFNAINKDTYHRSYIAPQHRKREMWICFPTGASEYANTAIVWNYEDDTIGVRDIPSARYAAPGIVDPGEAANWDADSQAWDDDITQWDDSAYAPTAFALLIGDQANSQFLEADKTNQFDGDDFISYATRESMPLIDRHNLKLIKAVYPRMTSSGNPTVQIRVGVQLHGTDAVSWGAEQDFVVGVDDKLDCLLKGRYVSFQVKSSGDVNWKLHSFDFEIELAERW